jgi:hypothetical protein
MFPENTQFDEVARRLLDFGGGELLLWLARFSPDRITFNRFLPSELKYPGVAHRICDAIAFLTDHALRGVPLAGLVEFQTRPDFDMFDRMGIAGHLFRLQHFPNNLPGDRWSLTGIVTNLTGFGRSSRTMSHEGSCWQIQFRERNLRSLDASRVLLLIARNRLPKSLAGFISLMRRGGEEGIIQRWLEVTAEMAVEARRELAAACVLFAELTGCQNQWITAVKDMGLIKSKYLTEIEDNARKEGHTEGQAAAVLRLLKRYTTVPADLEAAIRACQDTTRLDTWLDLASDRLPIEEFRKKAGI